MGSRRQKRVKEIVDGAVSTNRGFDRTGVPGIRARVLQGVPPGQEAGTALGGWGMEGPRSTLAGCAPELHVVCIMLPLSFRHRCAQHMYQLCSNGCVRCVAPHGFALGRCQM